MATLAAPGFYASPRSPISTTYDVMGHQTADMLFSPANLQLAYWHAEVTDSIPQLGRSFGARRGRRFK